LIGVVVPPSPAKAALVGNKVIAAAVTVAKALVRQ
jgi:hypothetical protein